MYCVKQSLKGSTKVAAYGRWLLSRGKYQYKIKIWEHSVWLLKTGWLLNKGDREHRFDCKELFMQKLFIVSRRRLRSVFWRSR